jgi:hypothetical protein
MTFEERPVRPPRRVFAFIDRAWRPAQLLAWRRWPKAIRFLVQLAPKGKPLPAARWIEPFRVRPRRIDATSPDEPDSAAPTLQDR